MNTSPTACGKASGKIKALADEKKMSGGLCFLIEENLCVGNFKEELMVGPEGIDMDEDLDK